MAVELNASRSRRSLLTTVGAAMAGAIAATMTGVRSAFGAPDEGTPIAIGTHYEHVHADTWLINNSNNSGVLNVGSNQSGTGVTAFSNSGFGISTQSDSGEGLRSFTTSGTAVHGIAAVNAGFAENYPAAVLGEARLPAGVSVLGNNYATSGIAIGVQGTSYSPTGAAAIGWAIKNGVGVSGHSGGTFPPTPTNAGVFGSSQNGRGGVFKGKTAQVRLLPSAAESHPNTGALGDLFLDKNARLWFCKGGTAWVKIA